MSAWSAATVSAGVVFAGVRAWHRHGRAKRWRAALDQERKTLALATGATGFDDWSDDLRRTIGEARRIRVLLETPIAGAEPPLLFETPWARRERCARYDAAVTELRRTVWEWLHDIGKLSAYERETLGLLGLRPEPFQTFLFLRADRRSDPWDEKIYAPAPSSDSAIEAATELRRELIRFERSLLVGGGNSYRRLA